MSDANIKERAEKTVDRLEEEFQKALKQAGDGETISDTDKIRERVKRIRERS